MRGLERLLRPRSVAVVGASSDPRKRGQQVLVALREAGFAGAVYPVNPRGGEILGLAVYPSPGALPEPADLALICLPAEAAVEAVAACGAAGIPAAVVLAVGFGESGDAGEALQARLLEAARSAGVRVVGPNTSGILNQALGLNLIGARGVPKGGISIVAQSGNVALSLMLEAAELGGEGIHVCVGLGNELDVGFHEVVEALAADPETRAIVVHAEGMRRPRAFLESAARASRVKPVLLLSGGRSRAGRRAARSHTGAVSGDEALLRAGLRQAGVVHVSRPDELWPVATTLAAQPPAREGGVALLSDGGGQGTLVCDALSHLGAEPVELSPRTREALRALLGRAASVANPVDLAGAADADPAVFARALEVLASDAGVAAVLIVGLFGGYAVRFSGTLADAELEAARRMAELARASRLPLVVHSMYGRRRTAPLDALRAQGVPVVASLDTAARCVAEAVRRRDGLSARPWPPAHRGHGDVGPAAVADVPDTARRVVEHARAAGRSGLTEPEARAFLRARGIPVSGGTLCRTVEEAEEAVARLGGPAALKVVSPHIAHKSDAGGVRLGVTAEEAGGAFREVMERAAAFLRGAGLPEEVEGVLVVEMLPPPLAEVLVGVRRDAGFGPVLTLGAGGVWVEVLGDVRHLVLPVEPEEIREALLRLRMAPLLTGARGRPPGDLNAVVEVALALEALAEEVGPVAEAEINPLYVYEDGVAVVDARVFLA